nr:flagellar hook-length control protein FliK [Halomonas campisalis]
MIDTLLHQVLGKRVDVPRARELNEPVRPVDAGEGPRALHSDSRLDGRRAASAPLTGTAPAGQRGDAADTRSAPADPARPHSFQTHFSPSARTIADLLVRFPAPPSVLSTSAPLMSAEEPPSATTLASRLQAGVRDSGLFYESHLSRWYRGEMSRQQLESEPQMWRTLRFTPAGAGLTERTSLRGAAAHGGGAPGAASHAGAAGQPGTAAAQPATSGAQLGAAGQPAGTAAAQPGGMGAPPGGVGQGGQPPPPAAAPPQPQGAASQAGAPMSGAASQAAGAYAATGALLPGSAEGAAARESGAAPLRSAAAQVSGAQVQAQAGEASSAREAADIAARARPAGAEPVHESLQGLVRHQLEMLVTPVLRWEGDVWSGIFMALMVQLPPSAQRDGGTGQEAEDEEAAQQDTWHSELQLRVPSLGDIRVALWLRGEDVRLELSVADERALATLRDGAPRLEGRLRAAGLASVIVEARPLREEGADGEIGA